MMRECKRGNPVHSWKIGRKEENYRKAIVKADF